MSKVKAARVPTVTILPTSTERKLYFDNNRVEDLLLRYVWTGCTRVVLRDEIMKNAEELIRQIILAHNLHRIYPGQEESALGDLFQTAWIQIERTLYKYKARPHCAQCYNPIRPQDSSLYEPRDDEYGIVSPEEVAVREMRCPTCGRVPSAIMYRGTSKVFNMWCVRPETMVYTTSGIDTIGNVVSRDKYDEKQEIWTIGANGQPGRVIAGGNKFDTDILDISVEGGYVLGCTPEHGLTKLKDDGPGWVNAGTVTTGDLLAIQCNQQFYIDDDNLDDVKLIESGNWSPPAIVNNDFAYILGLYIAEGSVSDSQVTIYNIDNDAINRLLNNTLGLIFKHHPTRQAIICSNKRFAEFIKLMDFGTTAKTKRIPDRLLRWSKPNIISLLNGLFDGDGHSSRYNGTVGFTSISKTLIDQVRMVLLNLGILTKLQVDKRTKSIFHRRGKTYISPKATAYQLICSSGDSKRFYEVVGFGIERKQSKSQRLKIRQYIYGLNSKFRDLHIKHGCGLAGYDAIRTIIVHNKCDVDVAARLLCNWDKYMDDPNYQFILERLNEYKSQNIRTIWLPVKSIVKARSAVADISVEAVGNTYIANGFVTHNSQVARTVILAYIKKESRDHKNADAYRNYLDRKCDPNSGTINRFLEEAHQLCKYNKNHMMILQALKFIMDTDERPYEGIIGKLVRYSNQSRAQVSSFLSIIRLRSDEFTDSPINERPKTRTPRWGDSGTSSDSEEE